MKYIALMALALACAPAIAGTSDVVPDGPDSFRVMLVGKTGFVSSGSLQKKAYAQATEFCTARSLVMETISIDSQRARPLGGFPEATLRFRCVRQGGDGVGSASPDTVRAPTDKYTQLEQLKRLLDSGALTQAEFDAEKGKVLGK